MQQHLIKQIDFLLPQTQCTRCDYPSCMDYAEAISTGDADINQCPPGGDEGIAKLAKLLDKPIKPLNPENGQIRLRQLAKIDEDVCIGCTLCIKACPVDAILGSNKMMHTVIADECTGCDLCLPVCPVDCIIMEDVGDSSWTLEQANKGRLRFENHNLRKTRDIQAREERLRNQALLLKTLRG